MVNIKKLDFLIAFYIASICIAELMGGKVFQVSSSIRIFGNPLGTSVAVFLIPLIYSINDVVIEVYGKKRMLSISRSGLLVVAFIAIMSAFFISLPTAQRSFITQETYEAVFSVAFRLSIASLIAFATSIFLDIVIFARLKAKLSRFGLWFRNNISNLISLFLDTVIFMYFAYFNFSLPNHSFLWSIIIPYWLYKMAMSVLVTPLVYVGVQWLKDEK